MYIQQEDMIGDNIAVIDLGTNSFHLLIAKAEKHGFEYLVKRKVFVHLASNGIDSIDDEAFTHGIEVLADFKKRLEAYNVVDYKVVGTAGLRNAKNSQDFRDKVKEMFGFEIEVIDGDREAELIYYGVRTALDLSNSKRLIMDIGGGSTEFVIANNKEIFWKRSYPLGVRVLANRFYNHDEPMTTEEYHELTSHLEKALTELWWQIKIHKPVGLVGVSGAFRTLINVQRGITQIYPVLEGNSDIVNLSGFKVAHLTMLRTTLKERLKIMDVEQGRAPLMPVATTFISVVMNHLHIQRSILVSLHALKEGLLWEMRDQYLTEA